MARRLAQLRTAMGEDIVEAVTISPPEPASVLAGPRSLPPRGRRLSALLALLLGSLLIWLSLQTEDKSTAVEAQTTQHTIAAPIGSIAAEPPTAEPPETRARDEQDIGQGIEAWRTAWAKRDIDGYLAAYSLDFAPADGSSRAAWVAARTQKLAQGRPIELQLRQIAIERIDENRFRASFLQDYASGSYRETARPKTLDLVRESGGWKILRETQETSGASKMPMRQTAPPDRR